MSNVINWIRTNILIVISVVVMLLAGVSFYWPTQSRVVELNQLLDKPGRTLKTIENQTNKTISWPGTEQTIRGTINQGVVDNLEKYFQEMNNRYWQLFNGIVSINRDGVNGINNTNQHNPMLEGLFPKPTIEGILFTARTEYQSSFDQLYSMLKAGTPPTKDQLEQAAQQIEIEYKTNSFSSSKFNKDQEADLAQRMAVAKRDLIVDEAGKILVYADPPDYAETVITGCFDVGQWVKSGDKPPISEIWQGQVGLWVQQDLVAAILLTNSEFNETGSLKSVKYQPVKKIININVITDIGRPKDTRARDDVEPQLVTGEGFGITPTGRISNPLYDVHHAELEILVDARQLPRLLNAIGRVNLMTPIIQNIQAIDQIEDFKKGYYYGPVDVVKVKLLIETIWMRRWTAGHTDEQAIAEYSAAKPEDLTFANMSDDEKVSFLKDNSLYNQGLMPDEIRDSIGLEPRDGNTITPYQR